MRNRCLALLFALSTGASMAQDRLVVSPDPGASPVGTAQDLSYSSASIRVSRQGNAITVQNPVGEAPSWRLTVRPVGSNGAVEGCYERARRFGGPARPEIDFSFGSSGCNNAFGRYRILELATDGGGQITNLAIDFNQQCERYGRAVAGQVRFNSAVPISASFHRAVIEPSGSFSFVAAPGAVGGGAAGGTASFVLQRATSSGQGNFDNGASFTYAGPLPGSPNGFWSLDFAAPGDIPLTVGSYPVATRFPFQGPNEAGLAFSYGGAGCNSLQGSFVVTDVQMDGLDNVPLRLDAAFDQRCPNSSGPLTEGTILFDANVIGPTSFVNTDRIFASFFETDEPPSLEPPFYTPSCD